MAQNKSQSKASVSNTLDVGVRFVNAAAGETDGSTHEFSSVTTKLPELPLIDQVSLS